MSDWKSVYKVRYEDTDPSETTGIYPPEYEVVHIPTGKIVARYKDHKYACKQARYRYRKDIRKMEKILLADENDAKEDLP